MDVSKFLSSTEFAEQLGVDPAHVCLLCRTGKISGARKFGRAWMIPKTEIKKQTRKPGAVGRPRKGDAATT